MPRINTVKKSQRDQGACLNCRTPLPTGTPYKWASKKTGPYSSQRLVWCASCSPRQSQLTSGNTSDLHAANESMAESLSAATCIGDVADALANGAEEVRAVGEHYTEGADNIEEGFGHETSQSEEMRTQGDELIEWADELETAGEDVRELDTEDGENMEELEALRADLGDLERTFNDAAALADGEEDEELQGSKEDAETALNVALARIGELEQLCDGGQLVSAQERAEEAMSSQP